jgi:two-component system phosphate regulon sensor histidine kinase PhoR
MLMAKNTNPLTPTEHVAELERERLVSLINSMGDAVIAVDEKLNIVIYNGASLNILDMNSSLLNQRIDDLINLTDKNNQVISLVDIFKGLKTQFTNRDYLIRYPSGDTINVYLSIAPVHLGYGSEGAKGFVILMRDITREKSLEEERDEFISVVSHELRTPIAIAEGNISNALYIVEKAKDLDPGVQHALDASHNQVIFLSGMINDLATLSRAERGKLEVEVETINVHELLDELHTNYLPQAEEKGLKLFSYPEPNLELLQSAKLYVREILQNFITNAIKYTETGSVTLSAGNKTGGVLFEVTDTGIGISKADKEKVFDKFFRSEDYRTRQSTGTGLGLYVTMKLARLIHAEISLESQIDKGSSFSIFIPNLN